MPQLISVIIPNYNHASFLEKRIESVLNQTYDNFELIILDDGSTDNSIEIINKYKHHPKLTNLVLNEKNSENLFLQWKKGVELAKGNWIWIAESDDIADKCFLEKLTSKIGLDTSYVYCKSNIIDENENKFSDTTFWLKDLSLDKWDNDFNADGIDLFFNYHAYKNVVSNTSSVLFRKDLFLKVKHYPYNYKICGDWLFFAQLSLMGNVSYVAEPLNFWRQHNATTRNSFSLQYDYAKLQENINIIQVFDTIAKEKNKKLDYRKYDWLVDGWVNKFLYKNVFLKQYMNPPFPCKLKCKFYFRISVRICNALFKSMMGKIK